MAQSSGIRMTFNQADFERVKIALMKLGDDKDKRSELLKILRREAKPSISVMRNESPIIESGRTITNKQGHSYSPGNLGRSIKSFTGRNKTFPSVFVGPQAKKAEGSGYYGFFVAHGTKDHKGKSTWANNDGKIGGIKKTNNFMEKTMNITGSATQRAILEDTAKYIEKVATRLGFD